MKEDGDDRCGLDPDAVATQSAATNQKEYAGLSSRTILYLDIENVARLLHDDVQWKEET